ncbi:MAG: NTP transferase domain-containing protein [Nanoarchaeota archaeon]|nr:NTP transferase domain-containing protein [Nanoarchaeota archaeon]
MKPQAVILAAGASTRMQPLTLTRPKPLLPMVNKPIIDHTLEQLRGLVKELVLVVGYRKEMIEQHLQNSPLAKHFAITLVEQKQQRGTGDALLAAKQHLSDRFLVLNGDDLYSQKDIAACLKQERCVLVCEVHNPEIFGVIEHDQDGKVLRIVEKGKYPPTKLANTGLFLLDTSIFATKVRPSKRKEIELTDCVTAVAKHAPITYHTVEGYWLPIGYPWNMLDAHEFLMEGVKRQIKGTVEKGATVNGNVSIGKGTSVLSGSYIDGPVVIGDNCHIGPNCYLRKGTVIGDNCHVGAGVEIKNSILFPNTKVPHLTYVGDSIIGENVNIGGGSMIANLRHDNANIKTMVKGKLLDTGRRKFGAVIGDNVKLGTKTIIYPGRKIGPGKTTLPGQIVKQDIR